MRRVDDGLADGAAAAGDGEHHESGGETGQPREARPHERAGDRQRHPPSTVGDLGDRHLEGERGHARHGDDRQHRLQVEPELVADLGKEDAEGGAVELVDGVEAEQDDEWIGGFAGTDAA